MRAGRPVPTGTLCTRDGLAERSESLHSYGHGVTCHVPVPSPFPFWSGGAALLPWFANGKLRQTVTQDLRGLPAGSPAWPGAEAWSSRCAQRKAPSRRGPHGSRECPLACLAVFGQSAVEIASVMAESVLSTREEVDASPRNGNRAETPWGLQFPSQRKLMNHRPQARLETVWDPGPVFPLPPCPAGSRRHNVNRQRLGRSQDSPDGEAAGQGSGRPGKRARDGGLLR